MTALALLLPLLALGGPAAAAVAGPKTVVESLYLDNGLSRGEWGEIEVCTEGAHAFAFEIKYSGVGYMDDVSVEGIRLYCETPDGSLTDLITSSEGVYGQWQGMRTCPPGEYVVGLRANVVPDMGLIGDDLGMDNLQMECSGGTILDGQNAAKGKGPVLTRSMAQVGDREMEAVRMKIRQSARARDFGDWGTWRYCSPGNSICGLQVRLEDDHMLEDDAGVTDVTMFCCN